MAPMTKGDASRVSLPHRSEIMWLVLEALATLGGKATARQIREKVEELGDFSPEQLALPGPRSKGGVTKLGDEVAWSLTSLKKGAGAVRLRSSSYPRTWALTKEGRGLVAGDMREVLRSSLRKDAERRRRR